MTRKKQRETYGKGSVTPEMVPKLDKDGNKVIGKDGRPVRVQRRNKKGEPAWRVCVTLGTETYLDENGKERKRQGKHQQVVYGTLEHARMVCEQLSAQYEHVDASARDKTFADAAAAWADSMRTNETCAPQRLKDYETRLRHVSARLGGKPLAEVKQNDVEAALASVKADRGLSQRSLREVHALAKRVFRYALANEWIVRNPMEGMTAPKVQRTNERRALSYDEAARLRACIDRDEAATFEGLARRKSNAKAWSHDQPRKFLAGLSEASGLVAVRLMLSTGIRRGEALALTWERIDLDGAQLHVCRAITEDMRVKPPKSAAGVRTIPLPKSTVEHLRAWRSVQADALERTTAAAEGALDTADARTLPVCSDGCGSWLVPSNFSRWWRSYSASIGFEGLRVHELRHTFASMLLENGESIKNAQSYLGHSTASMTLDQYGHKIAVNSTYAADVMEAAMSGEPVQRRAPIIRVGKTA